MNEKQRMQALEEALAAATRLRRSMRLLHPFAIANYFVAKEEVAKYDAVINRLKDQSKQS